jgi:hypothetical protein
MFVIVTRHHRATHPDVCVMAAILAGTTLARFETQRRRAVRERAPTARRRPAMTGPWKDRRFDARAWRMPAPHDANDPEAPGSAVEGPRITGFVLGYVVAVPAVLAMLVALLEHGW